MDHLFRRAIVLEVAQTAARISEFLERAPLRRRGPPTSLRLNAVDFTRLERMQFETHTGASKCQQSPPQSVRG
jgi:hypothetical protein